MLDAIEVRGFQSLADARIELGWLTVVEGPSNSGKSALVRALVMLARNARGTDYITTGKATCTVATGSAEEGFAVRLTRTARRGGDEYRVKVAEVPAAKVFTKLAGGVPEEVSALLRISELNIARQFDPPYLLTESGRDVAAVLGRLTNVSMVLAAAAEAGRRRKQLARDLKGAEQRRDDDRDLLAFLPLQHQPGDQALAVFDRMSERVVLAIELDAADRANPVGLLERIDQLVRIRRAGALHSVSDVVDLVVGGVAGI